MLRTKFPTTWINYESDKRIRILHEGCQNSKDRVMIHIDTLMRRTHYEKYQQWINDTGTNWKKNQSQ